MPGKRTDSPVPVGRKIRKARLDKKVSLEWLANETGCAVEYLKRLESGDEIPAVGTLLQLSRALDIDSTLLFKEQASRLTDRIAAFTKRTADYAYTALTPGAENKHLKAFRVAVDPLQEHHGVGYRHEGEEFVFVLGGSLDVRVGDHVNHLEAGESLHFNSGIKHKMINPGETVAEFISVIYVP